MLKIKIARLNICTGKNHLGFLMHLHASRVSSKPIIQKMYNSGIIYYACTFNRYIRVLGHCKSTLVHYRPQLSVSLTDLIKFTLHLIIQPACSDGWTALVLKSAWCLFMSFHGEPLQRSSYFSTVSFLPTCDGDAWHEWAECPFHHPYSGLEWIVEPSQNGLCN